MGNCCGGGGNEGEVKLMKGTNHNATMAKLFDEREILGKKGQ